MRSRCFRQPKNNFNGIDISQGLDWEPPSLSHHFLLVLYILFFCFVLLCFGHQRCIELHMRNIYFVVHLILRSLNDYGNFEM